MGSVPGCLAVKSMCWTRTSCTAAPSTQIIYNVASSTANLSVVLQAKNLFQQTALQKASPAFLKKCSKLILRFQKYGNGFKLIQVKLRKKSRTTSPFEVVVQFSFGNAKKEFFKSYRNWGETRVCLLVPLKKKKKSQTNKKPTFSRGQTTAATRGIKLSQEECVIASSAVKGMFVKYDS